MLASPPSSCCRAPKRSSRSHIWRDINAYFLDGTERLSLPGEEVPPVLLPVLVEQSLHRRLLGGQDLEPGQRGPDAVLFPGKSSSMHSR